MCKTRKIWMIFSVLLIVLWGADAEAQNKQPGKSLSNMGFTHHQIYIGNNLKMNFADTTNYQHGIVKRKWYIHSNVYVDTIFPISNTVIDTFPFAGLYPIKLVVEDSTGSRDSVTKNINVFEYLKSGFTYTKISGPPNFDYLFQDTSQHSSNIASRKWIFHNDTVSYPKDTLAQINKAYNTVGNFPVYLIVSDENGNTDTTFKQVGIIGDLDAGFEYYQTSQNNSYTLHFSDTSTHELPIGTRGWKFHNDSISYNKDTLAQIDHPYNSPGTYPVRLTLIDTFGTYDNEIKTVNVKHPVSTGFMHEQDSAISAPQYKLTFTDTGFSEYPVASRQWKFHNDTITVNKDSLQQITHFYPTPDTYSVSLMVTDTAGNTHETSKQISVKNYPKAHISGSVTAGQSIVHAGYVVLYESTPGNPAYPVDTSEIIVNSGFSYFYFSGVSIFRNYYLRALLHKNDSLFGQYLPTYYGNTTDWTKANILYIDSVYVPAPIKLVACSEEFSTGSGKISGHVYRQSDSSAAEKVSLVLTNSKMNPVAVTVTNDSGYYEFTQLPLHKLNVEPEAAGYYTGIYKVNLTALQPVINDVDFFMTDSLFIPDTSTSSGLHEDITASDFNIYPNPARDILYIRLSSKAELSQAELFSADGKVLLRKPIAGISGTIHMDVSNIEAGFAILRLHGKSGDFFKKIIIQ